MGLGLGRGKGMGSGLYGFGFDASASGFVAGPAVRVEAEDPHVVVDLLGVLGQLDARPAEDEERVGRDDRRVESSYMVPSCSLSACFCRRSWSSSSSNCGGKGRGGYRVGVGVVRRDADGAGVKNMRGRGVVVGS